MYQNKIKSLFHFILNGLESEFMWIKLGNFVLSLVSNNRQIRPSQLKAQWAIHWKFDLTVWLLLPSTRLGLGNKELWFLCYINMTKNFHDDGSFISKFPDQWRTHFSRHRLKVTAARQTFSRLTRRFWLPELTYHCRYSAVKDATLSRTRNSYRSIVKWLDTFSEDLT